MATTCLTAALLSSMGSVAAKFAFEKTISGKYVALVLCLDGSENCTEVDGSFIRIRLLNAMKICYRVYNIFMIVLMVILNSLGISFLVKSMNQMYDLFVAGSVITSLNQFTEALALLQL